MVVRAPLSDSAKERSRVKRQANELEKRTNRDTVVYMRMFVQYLRAMPPETTVGSMLQASRSTLTQLFPLEVANVPLLADRPADEPIAATATDAPALER